MTLPTGSISMSQVNSELQRSATQHISLDDGQVRQLAGVGGGAISMSQLRGKSWLTFSSPPGQVEDQTVVSFTITSNLPVSWSYTNRLAEVSSTSTSITFTLRARRQSGQWAGLETTVDVTGSGYGVSRSWSVRMVATGTDGGWIDPL